MAGTVVHGMRAVCEALRAGRRVNRVYLANESRGEGWREVVELAKAAGARYEFVPQAKVNALAQTKEHQGIAAEVSPADYAPLRELLCACPARATLLAVDQVQHSRNLGLLIRSALGAGASGVIVPARGGALLDENVVRASSGAVFHLPIAMSKNLPQDLRAARDAGFWIYALEPGGEHDVFRMDWPERSLLVVGNETSGLRPVVRKACDAAVSVPMAGGLESLNAAVAASVALFSIASQRRRDG